MSAYMVDREHVLCRTPETELAGLLEQWKYARRTLNSSEMFEASAYQELVSAAQNVETDPDRLSRAIEHHTELSARIADERSAEDGLRARTRMALVRMVGQTYLRLDAEASLAEADAYDMQITRAIADRIAVEGR
jgi:hypothetical protein